MVQKVTENTRYDTNFKTRIEVDLIIRLVTKIYPK